MQQQHNLPIELTCFSYLICSFEGIRYTKSVMENDYVLLYDVNGYIAGMQTMVPVSDTYDDAFYPFSTLPYYVLGDFFGEPVRIYKD